MMPRLGVGTGPRRHEWRGFLKLTRHVSRGLYPAISESGRISFKEPKGPRLAAAGSPSCGGRPHGRSDTWRTLDPHGASRLMKLAVDLTEAEARVLADVLPREERF